tara:strand:- start:1231 stop:1809 length:579 start_codon:yes stop_codon:yes gene_type:complete
MTKLARKFHEIERHTAKAVLVRIERTDESAVWFPKHRVDLDEDAQSIAATEKLWAEKDPQRAVNFRETKRQEETDRREYNNELVLVGELELSASGKAGFINVSVDEEITDQVANRRAYFPMSQVTVDADGVAHVPRWLIQAKAGEIVYEWTSNRGSKGIDHLGGAAFAVHFPSETVSVSQMDLYRARDRYHG